MNNGHRQHMVQFTERRQTKQNTENFILDILVGLLECLLTERTVISFVGQFRSWSALNVNS
jgi:hypothetical protein